jgi:hypothetical protein
LITTLSRLSKKKVAQQVYLAAEKYGLNPDFVLPLAYAESGFIQKARSEYGAQGVMQISEDAAKRYKCDPTDLADNIDCGMRIIKSHIENPKIGNDPYKVVIAYNTKSDTLNKFLDAYNSDPDNPEKHMHLLPEATKKHIANIEDYFGGNLPNVGAGEPAKQEETSTQPPKVDTSNDFKKDDEKTVDTSADDAEKKRDAERKMSAGLGALVGTSLGTGAAGVQGVADVGSAVLNAIRNQQMPTQAATPTSTPVEPSAPVDTRTPGEKWNKTGYGVGTGSVRDVSSRFQRIAPDPESKVANKYVKKFGSKALRQAEEQAAKDAFWAKHIAEVDRLNAAQQAAKQAPSVAPMAQAATADSYPMLSKIMKGASYLKYPVLGGLTGLGIGSGAAETYGRYKEGDKSGAALSGTGTALNAVAPFLGGLAGLSTGAGALAIPLYQAAGDRLKHLQRHPEDYRLAPNDFDALGNPLQ